MAATPKRLCGKQMSIVGAVGFENTHKRSFNNLSERHAVVIINEFRTVPAHWLFLLSGILPSARPNWPRVNGRTGSGQVAQVVERSPEKAGVGGSTPSLATMFSIT